MVLLVKTIPWSTPARPAFIMYTCISSCGIIQVVLDLRIVENIKLELTFLSLFEFSLSDGISQNLLNHVTVH